MLALLALDGAMAKECADPMGLEPKDECKIAWSKLQKIVRPTQNSVGYAWVQYIVEKDMGSKSDTQSAMDDKIVPVVSGPSDSLYIIDHHHHLAAVDFSGFDVDITIHMVCNYTSMPTEQFWNIMAAQGYSYLFAEKSPNALPSAIPYSALPTSISFKKSGLLKSSTFVDDRWRALAGYVRKIKKSSSNSSAEHPDADYSSRCYNRACSPATGESIPFFEYRWAYFFDSAYSKSTLWDSSDDFTAFKTSYDALPSSGPGGAVVADWATAAEKLIPLCRGNSAGAFDVPSNFGNMSGPLPGYHKGTGPSEHAR